MVVLFCAVVGEHRIITIDISNDQPVGILKEQIKMRAMFDFPSDKLALYLAKTNGNKDGEWMKEDDDDLAQLQQATIPDDIEEMHLKEELLLKPMWKIKTHFTGAPDENVIHVLIDPRGKDHVRVAVANANSPLLPGGKKSRGEKCIEYAEEQQSHDGSQYFHVGTIGSALSSLVSSFLGVEKIPASKKNA